MTWQHHRRHRRHHRPSHGFGPWARTGRFFDPGEVRLALLSLLGETPQHGYQLMRGLEERSGGTYRASPGTVYPTLSQLEDEGLVTSRAEDGKRIYRLSEAGRAELERKSEAVERIWRRAEDWGSWNGIHDPAVAELIRPAIRLMKNALRSISHSDDSRRVDSIREILGRAREEIEALGDEP